MKNQDTFQCILKLDTIKLAIGESIYTSKVTSLVKEAGKELINMGTSAAYYADSVNTMSTQTGIATDTIQELQYAEELMDVSVNTVTGSMTKNIKAMNNARDGSATYVEAYKKIGVQVTDTNGHLRDSETVFWECIDSLGNPVTAPVVKEMFVRYYNGDSTGVIADDLTSRGIVNERGNPFTSKAILYILRNRKYIGIYEFRGELIPNVIPSIIEEDLFMDVNNKLELQKKAPGKAKAKVPYLLTGILYCKECGGHMVGESGTGKSGKIYNYYKCMNKKKKLSKCAITPIQKDYLENMVLKHTIADVLQDDVIHAIADKIIEILKKDNSEVIIKEHKKQLREVDKGINNMLNAIQQGIVTESTKERLNELEAKKADITAVIALEEIKKPTLTREHVIYWLSSFKNGDITDDAFKNKIVNTFIRSVICSDKDLTINYNYQDGTHTIKFDGLESCSDSSHQVE